MLSELTENQREHLVWRLDHKTSCGYITALAIARGEHLDMKVSKIFELYGGKSKRSAKIHSHKVCTYDFIDITKIKKELGLNRFQK